MHIEQLEIAALTNCPHAANDTRAIRHHQKVVWPASQRPELFWRLVEEPAFERGCVVLVVRKAHLGDGTTEHFHRCFRVGIQSRSNINARRTHMCCRTLSVGTGGLARHSTSLREAYTWRSSPALPAISNLTASYSRLPPVPSTHHMVNRPCVFNSQLSCHTPNFSDFLNCVNTRD